MPTEHHAAKIREKPPRRASTEEGPDVIAVAGAQLLWINFGITGDDGSLRTLPVSGGAAPTTLANAPVFP